MKDKKGAVQTEVQKDNEADVIARTTKANVLSFAVYVQNVAVLCTP
jgi:hypothetical protein